MKINEPNKIFLKQNKQKRFISIRRLKNKLRRKRIYLKFDKRINGTTKTTNNELNLNIQHNDENKKEINVKDDSRVEKCTKTIKPKSCPSFLEYKFTEDSNKEKYIKQEVIIDF